MSFERKMSSSTNNVINGKWKLFPRKMDVPEDVVPVLKTCLDCFKRFQFEEAVYEIGKLCSVCFFLLLSL